MTTKQPLLLSSTIFDDLKSNVDDKKMHPWRFRTPYVERANACSNMMRRVGARHAGATLDNYQVYDDEKQRPAFEKLKAWSSDMPANVMVGGGLVLWGTPGTGKDHLMCSLAYKAVLEHGFKCRWESGGDTYEKFRQLNLDNSYARKDWLETRLKPQILIISDLLPPSSAKHTDAFVSLLFELIDQRYRGTLSTWATFNARDGRDMSDKTSEALIDRLQETSLVLKCDWKSYRRRNRK